MKEIRIFAPATVSNVGPGFDLMGFSLGEPGDILHIRKTGKSGIRIINSTDVNIPLETEKNVAGVAVRSFLDDQGIMEGFEIEFLQKIKPGSGIGSSAASATAAVYGVNHLLGKPLSSEKLIEFALKGEYIASRSIHADNVAPAMLGGIILIRRYNPLDIIRLKAPESLWCSIVHPDIEIKTAESRKLIPENIPLPDALAQCGNIAALIAGITSNDYDLIFRSLEDRIAEPVRKNAIPGYDELKKALNDEGINGINISGSGPSVFALTRTKQMGEKACTIMGAAFTRRGINCKTYLSRISEKGTRIMED